MRTLLSLRPSLRRSLATDADPLLGESNVQRTHRR